MKKEDNLVPFTSEQSREEAKRNGKKGGIASGKARRERAALKETLEYLLNCKAKDKNGKPIKNIIDGEQDNYQSLMMSKLVLKAGTGNLEAIRLVQSIKGEETKNVKVDADVKADVDVSTLPDKILFDIADKLQGIEGE